MRALTTSSATAREGCGNRAKHEACIVEPWIMSAMYAKNLSMIFRSKCPIYSTHRSKIGDKIAADEVKYLFYPLIEY